MSWEKKTNSYFHHNDFRRNLTQMNLNYGFGMSLLFNNQDMPM
jgi:hypothetical protein